MQFHSVRSRPHARTPTLAHALAASDPQSWRAKSAANKTGVGKEAGGGREKGNKEKEQEGNGEGKGDGSDVACWTGLRYLTAGLRVVAPDFRVLHRNATHLCVVHLRGQGGKPTRRAVRDAKQQQPHNLQASCSGNQNCGIPDTAVEFIAGETRLLREVLKRFLYSVPYVLKGEDKLGRARTSKSNYTETGQCRSSGTGSEAFVRS